MTTTVPAVRAGVPEARSSRRPLADRWWFAIVFVIAFAVFAATDAGRMIFDTKLGVDLNAAQFLHRLWSLWNPLEWFGSLQDQYIGYAIPMAPFFAVLQLAHIPIWLIERLWLSLLVAAGFTGMVKLARALRIGSDATRLVAGAVFALWPTFTIVIGSTSAAALPGLVAPWAVLPLVGAAAGRTPAGRAAARSGVAVALMAGVNAFSTLAVLLLPALYIVTRSRGRLRVELGIKWIIAVVAGTAWWLVPLLLQARYSFDFLPYIEQSGTTSATMSAAAVLRGTGTWTAYLNLDGGPWLPAGWAMVTSPVAIIAAAAAAATGLAGLARRDMPERRWLCSCAGLAAAVAMAGYFGPLGGPFHVGVNSLLDGAFAPFRSMYKLEPVIAVALALGCAHALQRCWRLSFPLWRGARIAAGAATAPAVALVLVGLALPQLTGQALQPGSFTGVPGYWYRATAWLAAHSPRQTALVVPASSHGQFTWGETIDDPMESLATSPWAERGLVPYGGAGSQILLETVEQAVESGQQVPGLAGYLARAGVRYVVVRNDINPAQGGYTPPQVVNETLALSGFQRVASFGPQLAAAPGYPDIAGLVPGLEPSYPAVEIFQASDPADRPTGPVTALAAKDTVLVNGGPDSLLQLEGQGTLDAEPTVIAGDSLEVRPALWAVTDGQRRTDNDFGTTRDYQSFTYTATETNPIDDPLGGAGNPPRQLLPVPATGHQTVAVLRGAASVTASSAGSWLSSSPEYAPVNAFDGNPDTAWTENNPQTPVGQWIQISFDHAIDLPAMAGIQLLDDTYARSIANQLLVTTAAGAATTYPVSTGSVQPLRIPPGPTRWLRITIAGADNVVPGNPGAGISDVLIPGVRVTTYLQPAQDPAGPKAPAEDYSFTQQVPSPYGQADLPQPTVGDNLARTFVTPRSARLTAGITAVPDPGPALSALISRLSPASKSQFKVTASSSWNDMPELGPDNLFQRGSQFPWLAQAGDPHPYLKVSWHGLRTISEVVLQPAYGLGAAPTGVLIGSQAGHRLVNVGLGGIVRISPPLRTDRLYLLFPSLSSNAAGNTAAGQPAQLPVGLAKVTIPALAGLHIAASKVSTPFRLPCGQGPLVFVDGRRYQTSVSGTLGDLVNLTAVRAGLCTAGGGLRVTAGRQWLTADSSSTFTVSSLSLRSGDPATGSATAQPGFTVTSRPLTVQSWQPDNRTLRLGPGPSSYVEIHENANPGWAATMNGRPLRPVTLDGWQQGYLVPAGRGGTITLTFRPAEVYHAGIIGSAIALLALLIIAFGTAMLRRHRTGKPFDDLGPDQGLEHPNLGPAASSTNRSGAAKLARVTALLLPLTAVVFVAGGLVAIAVPVLAVIGYWRPRLLPAVAAVGMVGAGLVTATAQNPTQLGSGPFSGPAQVCALVALAAALMPVIKPGAEPAAEDAPPA
jgi:arabinofuranan 3-O-arabinosyltransferase